MIDWESLAWDNRKISFEYKNKIITGVVQYYIDDAEEYDDPEERDTPFFSLKSPYRITRGYHINEVSNVKILD